MEELEKENERLTNLLYGLLGKWNKIANQLNERYPKEPKFIQSYQAGKLEQLEFCINDLRRHIDEKTKS